KEEAHDYRYFPEPDLPPVRVSPEWIERVRSQIPELPAAKRARLVKEYGLSDYDARILAGDRAMADFFEEAARLSGKPKPVANWLVNELNKILNDRKIPTEAVKATPKGLVELLGLVESGALTGASAKEVFLEMVERGTAPADVMRERGLARVTRAEDLEAAARAAIEANPTHAMPWNTMGTIVTEQGDLATAQVFFDEALRLQPDFAKARYNRA
ncbi:MAG: hypothetical protein ACK44W_18435, partial [Planctomycetota bacterium]